MRWEPDRTPPALPYQPPGTKDGLLRGLKGLCPVCGKGRLFAGYLRVAEACESCHAPLGRLRAAPPQTSSRVAPNNLVPATSNPMLQVMALQANGVAHAC